MDLVAEVVVDDDGWVIVPIVKRPGTAFPERFSIGRARNCDIVLRHHSVSKLHAHLHANGGRIVRVTDYQSANGTSVNGKSIQAGGDAVKHWR